MPLPELQPINPFAGFLQGRQARRQEGVAEQQNALMQLQFSEAQRKAQQEQGLNALYQGAVGPAGELDYTKLISGAAQQGYGGQIPGLVKQRAETESAQRAAEKDKIAATLKRIEVGAQLMSGVRDQASYDAARQQAAQVFGPEFVQQMPAVYNPQEIEANRLKAMSIKDQLDQHWKQMGYDLDAEKFTYQQQNDAANRGVTLRGQNLADARAKETQGKGQYDPTRGVIVDPRTGEARPVTMAGGGALPPRQPDSRPIPATILKQATESREALRASESMEKTLTEARGLVEGTKPKPGVPGKAPLETGPLDRAGAAIRQFTGAGTEGSRGLLRLKQLREKLRGDYLLLAKGVQTEGDAKRAMDAMMPDTNDPDAILMQLDTLAQAQKQLQALHDESLSQIEQEYQKPLRGASSNAPPSISSDAEDGFRYLGPE